MNELITADNDNDDEQTDVGVTPTSTHSPTQVPSLLL